mgnify:CR=1 FL=1
MKYIVQSIAINRKTGQPVTPIVEETIDTETNDLFAGARHAFDIEQGFEEFWRDSRVGKIIVLSAELADN